MIHIDMYDFPRFCSAQCMHVCCKPRLESANQCNNILFEQLNFGRPRICQVQYQTR